MAQWLDGISGGLGLQSQVAACALDASAHILAYARAAGLDPLAFLVNVAAVLASAALAAQPEAQRLAASRHIQHALGLVHCLDDEEVAAPLSDSFTAPETLQ